MAPSVFPSEQREGWVHCLFTVFNRRPLSKRRLNFVPFDTAPVIRCVVSSKAAALKQLL
jgi:hypothetical protein